MTSIESGVGSHDQHEVGHMTSMESGVGLLLMLTTTNQVKDCYLVSLLEQLHTEDKKTIIIFTPTCRYLERL